MSALAAYDGDFYVITPHSTGMMGDYVYDVFYDDVTGQTWIAADDPIWDEGGFASTVDGLTWDTYSNVNDEVPTHIVGELRRGPDGELYMASEAGLLVFNGTEAEVVWSKANAPVWPHNGVTDFDWDSQGNLWVTLAQVNTTLGGVAKYDGVKWTLYNSQNGSIPWTKPWDSVETIDIDSQDRVWVGNSVVGAAMYDGVKWTWYEPKWGLGNALPSGWVDDILVEDDGTAWFATLGGGVARLVGNTWTVWDQTVEGTLNTNDISSLSIDRDGDVWLTTFIGGAWEFTGTTWDRNDYPLTHVYGLAFDELNRPIVVGIGGMVFTDGQLYTYAAVSLSNRWLDASLAHSDGTMWFGGGGGGVTQYDGVTWKSWNPYNEGIYDWPFATDAVEDVVEGLDGHVFVNAINHGIGEWDGTEWIEHIGTQSIEMMDIAPDGTLWAGPYNGAELVTYDGATWRQVNVPYTAYSGDMYTLAVDPLGDVWFGTIIGLYHSSDGGVTWTTYHTGNSDLPHNNVFDLEPEPDGSGIWIATEGGLAFYDGVTWTTYTMANSGLPADSVDTLEIAPDGALWVGAFDGSLWPYDGGLARFDGTTWRTWTEENSNLPHEEIWSIGIDATNNVWVGTASEGIGVLYVEGDGAGTFESLPLAWRAHKGTWISGDVLALSFHDDAAVWVETVANGPKTTNAVMSVDLQTHVANPSSMTIDTEIFTDGVMGVSTYVKNFDTGKWDQVGTEQKLDLSDGSATLIVPSPAAHIDANGFVQVAFSARAPVSRNPFGPPSLGVDLVEMTITE